MSGSRKGGRGGPGRGEAPVAHSREPDWSLIAEVNAGAGTWRMDVAAKVITISEQAAELFRVPQRTLEMPLEEWLTACVHPNDHGRIRQGVRDIISRRDEHFSLEYRLVHDGKLARLVWTTGKVMNPGDRPELVGVCIDVTTRNRVEQRLSGINGAFAQTLADAPAGDDRVLEESGLISSPLPLDSIERIAAIEATGLLNGAREAIFDSFTELVRRSLDVPMALITLVGPEDQFFVSAQGLPEPLRHLRTTPTSHSFCRHVIERGGPPLIIRNTATNPLTAQSPLACQGLAAYLAVPLKDDMGNILGAFCAIDREPRCWTTAELATLSGVTELLMNEIENRVLLKRLDQALEHKQSLERARQLSDQWFETAQRANPDGFMIFRSLRDHAAAIVDFEWLYVNPAAEQIEQRRATDLVGKRLLEEMPAASDLGLFQAYAGVVETGENWQGEYAIEADDNASWFKVSAVRLGDGVAVTIEDITDRKQAELALRRNATQLRNILDNVVAVVGTLTPEGILTEANEPAFMAGQIDRESVIGKPFWECYWWNYSQAAQSQLKQAVLSAAAGEVVRFNAAVRVADGRIATVDCQLCPRRDEDGHIVEIVASGVDISDRELAEQRFKATFDNAAVGVAHVAPDGTWLRVNDRLAEIVGYSPEELTYLTFQDLTHPSDLSADLDSLRRLLRGDITKYSMEKRYIRKDDQIVWVNLTVSSVRTKGGEVDYLIAIVEDIGERKRQEERVHFLMREVNHRAKNLLAVVQAIARQTAKDASPADFAVNLCHRLQGLAASQDLIISGDWEAVTLRDLIDSQLGHLGDDVRNRVRKSGDVVRLTPAAAQGIGLALHELATNALKYGALSNTRGYVEITWHLRSTTAGGRFELNWFERGGPTVSEPNVRGFGRVVIERMAAQSVGGKVDLVFDPQGLRWTLEAPEKEILYAKPSVVGRRQK